MQSVLPTMYHSLLLQFAPEALETYAKEKKIGIEAAARHFRYHGLITAAAKKNIVTIFIAHHADDQRETFLCDLCAEEASKAFQVCHGAFRSFQLTKKKARCVLFVHFENRS